MAKHKCKKGAPKWMATFSDLMTLVLVFFVMLFAVSTLDAVKFQELKKSMEGIGLGEQEMITVTDTGSKINMTQKNLSEGDIEEMTKKREQTKEIDVELDELYKKIKAYIKEKELEDKIAASREEDGVLVTILDDVLFDSGKAEIKPGAKEMIDALTGFFLQVENDIQIEGHTDNRPINSYQFPSNWELSTSRATSVIRYLIENHTFNPSRFSAMGYAETRPVAPNDTKENMQKNRRIVILIKEK